VKHSDDTKKYIKLFLSYKNVSQTKRNIQRAHFKAKQSFSFIIGILFSLISILLKDIPDENWRFLFIIILMIFIFLIGRIIKDASLHLSAIEDVEKEKGDD